MNSTDDKLSQASFFPEQPSDFGALAYIKPINTDRGLGYAVCSSDGTQLAVFSSRDVAMFAARQHDLEPSPIH